METKDCFLLGYVSKIFGFKGEVILFIDADDSQRYLEMESVFVNKGNKLIPFFIDKIQAHSKQNHFIAKFQDINNEEQAAILVGAELYLPLSMLPKLSGKQFYYHEVIGYTINDENFGMLGKVEDIIDMTSNPIFQVSRGNKEVLLPIHDDFIISVNRDSKIIVYKAPAGLIEMYLDDSLYSDKDNDAN